MMAILLPMLIILAGFAINLAYLQLVRTEMQIATDASVRAANRMFLDTGNMSQAVNKAQEIALQNPVNNTHLKILQSDFTRGRSTRPSLNSRYSFAAQNFDCNALQLKMSMNPQSLSGPVKLLFPNILGSQLASISADAVSTQVELDIALVIDRSGSMAYADLEKAEYPPVPAAAPYLWEFGDPVPSPSRWLDTRNAVATFVQELQKTPQSEKVCLITYADTATVDCGLTNSYSLLLDELDFYSGSFHLGGTNIGDGIQLGTDRVVNDPEARPWATKELIVMTDGIYNVGSDPKSKASAAAQDGVMVFSITFSAEANQSKMISVAEAGGGEHFHAASAQDLKDIFREIASRMPTLISR